MQAESESRREEVRSASSIAPVPPARSARWVKLSRS